jgi:hypothetical protein
LSLYHLITLDVVAGMSASPVQPWWEREDGRGFAAFRDAAPEVSRAAVSDAARNVEVESHALQEQGFERLVVALPLERALTFSLKRRRFSEVTPSDLRPRVRLLVRFGSDGAEAEIRVAQAFGTAGAVFAAVGCAAIGLMLILATAPAATAGEFAAKYLVAAVFLGFALRLGRGVFCELRALRRETDLLRLVWANAIRPSA